MTIGALILFQSPTIIIAGFIPLFFDNAAVAVYANKRAGARAAMILPFFTGIVQVLGAAFIASWVGLSQYGGYIGMLDWDTVWPAFTVLIKFLGFVGVAVVILVLVAIPQLQYRRGSTKLLPYRARLRAVYSQQTSNEEYTRRCTRQSNERQNNPMKILVSCANGSGTSLMMKQRREGFQGS